ncbi:MFS transporter [Nocardioides sp. NPDC057772]|uniref:MFS transporter n=1 Tax=Nocardioides sp. NPDC057772 TaxID=3346245 RepID=UPI00366C725B
MHLTEAIRHNPMSRFQWLVVAICIVLTMIDGYEILITSFTLPALTAEWDLSPAQQGLVASFGTLGMGIGAVFLSPLADRIGRRRHIIGALGLLTVSMILAGLAPSYELFLGFRFFGGLVLGGIVASINVLVAEYSNAERRGVVMGVYGIGLPLGAAIGGFLSVALIANFTWRGPYFFAALVTAVVMVVAIAILPESVSYLVAKRPANALATYNEIAGKIGVPAATELPPAPEKAVSETFVGGVFSGVLSGVMLPRTLLLWLAYGTLIASFYFANSLTAKLVAEATGDPDFGINAQAMVAAGGVIGALVFSMLSRWIHPRLVTGVVMLFGFGVFVAFAAFFTDRTMVMALAVLVGLAVNGGVAAYYAISPSIYPLAIRAAAVGLMMGLGRVVAFFAPNVATFLQGLGYGPDDLYRIYGLVLVVSAVAVTGLHLVYRGQKDAMDDEADEAATLAQARA